MHKLHTHTIRYLWYIADGCYWAEKHGVYAEQERTTRMINWRGKLVDCRRSDGQDQQV